MKFNNYFNNLARYWSANFLAALGFVSFLFGVTGVLALNYFDPSFTINITSPEIKTKLIESCKLFVKFQTNLFPIICIIVILPAIVQITLLLNSKLKIRTQLCMLFGTIIICILPWFNFFNMHTGGGIWLVFIPYMFYPIIILAGVIYIALLLIDLLQKPRINNQNLAENKFYRKIINIFFYYSLIILYFAVKLIIDLHNH